jgi:hypothetical protein
MQMNEKNILVCGGLRGLITFWDIHLGKLVSNIETIYIMCVIFIQLFLFQLSRFQQNESYNVKYLKLGKELLITGSNLQVRY